MGQVKLALFGHPVEHARSPEIHAKFARSMSLDMSYDKIDATPEAFEAAVREFFASGGRGCNITLPHKIAAHDMADELTRRAMVAGAVNVFRASGEGDLVGENTDGTGLMHDIEVNLKLPLAGKRVLILGASGAARGAAAAALRRTPKLLHIANRDRARAETLAADIDGVVLTEYDALDLGQYDLIINATSASLYGELPPLPDQRFKAAAYDLVYLDEPTPFQEWAMSHGAVWASDGWGMLVEQAAVSWEFWRLGSPETMKVRQRKRVLRTED